MNIWIELSFFPANFNLFSCTTEINTQSMITVQIPGRISCRRGREGGGAGREGGGAGREGGWEGDNEPWAEAGGGNSSVTHTHMEGGQGQEEAVGG